MGSSVSLLWSRLRIGGWNSKPAHFVRDYERLVRIKLKEHPNDRALALAQSIGSPTMELFRDWGERQVQVLRYHGLIDGMSVYDLGCGCGRTAQELQRSGWQGRYFGVDIIAALVDEIRRTCPDYDVAVHREFSIIAADDSLDILFNWSVFTHLYPEETFVYMQDIFRSLKPGGKLIFSFLEMGNDVHEQIFYKNVDNFRRKKRPTHLDQFLHRDWICRFAERIGFSEPQFTDGQDDQNHRPFGQTIAVMSKPAR
jgi:SAM-dependent methyltransferase